MVLKEGLEPSRYFYHRILSPVRLPFRHFSMVSHRRLELRTPSLKVKCSTTELVGHNWLVRVDSNHRMSESKSDALPLGYNPKWWTEVDSNHWNRGWLIYSQLRLAASLSVQTLLYKWFKPYKALVLYKNKIRMYKKLILNL